jgi:hypothetical protein
MLLTAARFNQYLIKRKETEGHSPITFFEAEMGAEAVRKRLRTLDTFSLHKILTERIPNESITLMEQAFHGAYFFEYVDAPGFEHLRDEFPDDLLIPD